LASREAAGAAAQQVLLLLAMVALVALAQVAAAAGADATIIPQATAARAGVVRSS
jgi:hypothetical protein